MTSDEKAKIYDEAVKKACAYCMVAIELDVPRNIYAKLNGPVLARLIGENPYGR